MSKIMTETKKRELKAKQAKGGFAFILKQAFKFSPFFLIPRVVIYYFLDEKPFEIRMIVECFMAYNAARLREACQLFTKKMLEPDVTIGVTLTGALTPAGLGISALIPLIKAGFIDWIISTGANLYHDTHFGIGLELRQGSAQISDTVLREEEVVRIYDIFFDYSVLLDTDAFFRTIIASPELQRPMSTAE